MTRRDAGTCAALIAACFAVAVIATDGRAAEPSATPTRQRRVLYNFDGCSCMFTKAGSKGPVPITIDDVRRLIEEVAYEGSRVDTVLVCVNAQVTYYPTTIGTMLGQPPSKADGQWLDNLSAFYAKGIDPYAVMLAEARARGREAIVSFRMNDDHGTDSLRTQFLVDHADWRLGTKQYQGSGALDFARDEVREYTFRLIEECARRYDCDGLELDFNRFPRFFTATTPEAERLKLIDALVERVRRMLDELGQERGRRLLLCVRVPSNFNSKPPTPESARAIGCDVPAWAAKGWLDFVTVSEYLCERGDLPITAWREAISSVPVYGGIECMWPDDKGKVRLSADEYLAQARALLDQRADGIYLFNFFTCREAPPYPEPPFAILATLGDPPTAKP